MPEQQFDINKFLEQDKQESTKRNSGQKAAKQYLTLSKPEYRGCTFIYKPLLDINGRPHRRIKHPLELHINVPDAQGNLRWRTYSMFGDPAEYGRLTESEAKLYEDAKKLLIEVGQWSDEKGYPYLTDRKFKVVFYAYALALLDKNGADKLPAKGFTICEHTSAKFMESFHTVRETRNKVSGGGFWINDYYNIEMPAHNVIVTTEDNTSTGIGMAVTVDFMPRKPEVSVEDLKEAQQLCQDLNKYSVNASFDPEHFKEIIHVCSEWKKTKLAERSSRPAESSYDSMPTEPAQNNVGPAGAPVSPAQGGSEPPPPSSEMRT